MASCDRGRVPALVLSVLLALAACDSGPAGSRPELLVYAATSTRDVLQALEPRFELAHPVDVVFNFGSSGDLARQLVAAGKADVFLSADERELDRVEAAGLVRPGTRRALLSNQLVVVAPVDARAPFPEPFEPAMLRAADVQRLSLANVETVPSGRYAKAWLTRAGVWDDVAAKVLPGVDVRAALAAVESGAADAGIVYRTDAARSTRARVVYVVPVDEGPPISYPVAAIAGRPTEPGASAFLAFLAGPEARVELERAGFVVLAEQQQR